MSGYFQCKQFVFSPQLSSECINGAAMEQSDKEKMDKPRLDRMESIILITMDT